LVHPRRIANETADDASRWRCEVVVSSSVPDGIASIARRENADLIVMYTREWNGLSTLIKGSIAEKVRRTAATEVRIFRSRELIAA
jgi:nucleotide-binding universal stress UspA family protein